MDAGDLFPREKRTWFEADNSVPSRSQPQNEWSYTSYPPYAPMALQGSFTITFTVYFNTNQEEENKMPLGTNEKNNLYFDIRGLSMLSFRNAVAITWLHGEAYTVCLHLI